MKIYGFSLIYNNFEENNITVILHNFITFWDKLDQDLYPAPQKATSSGI
jgi:hypothetical protein